MGQNLIPSPGWEQQMQQQPIYKELATKDYIAFFAMVIGMFMAILDIQIVASSLSVIAAGLSASGDEMSWVQTSYMVAEVIIIPVTGFLSRSFSTRISFVVATLGFTVFSVCCSMAWSINSMIVFRALQGLFGGAMIPTVFATIFTIFPAEQRKKMGILLGLVVTIAPTLGPTIGGYITEFASWRMMFLINLLPGILASSAVWLYGDFDKKDLTLLNNFDYLGVIMMAVGLGCLEYLLEEGTSHAWFESGLILSLSFIVAISLTLFIIREITFANPVIHLNAFRYRNFTLGCILTFVLGIGLFGVVYIMPLFLYRVAGMNTVQIGIVMMVTGGSQFLIAPLAGFLNSRGVDQRKMLCGGMITFAAGCYLNGNLTPDSRFWEFLLPQMLRGGALMFCFIPINEIVFSAMPQNEIKNASGLYNLMRNLGGAIGLAVINTILINNVKRFSGYLAENMTVTDAKVIAAQHSIAQLFHGRIFNTHQATLDMINGLLQRDALIIAINNVFVTFSLIFICSLVLVPLVDKQKSSADGVAGH